MKFLSQDGLAYLWTKIQAKLDALASRITTDETAIAGKVDKVEGKGLSTEDYTTAEKAKLAGVEAGANAYTLPAATSGALGGVKQGANVSIAADGTLSATDTTYGEATTGSAGLMSAADKTKLNGIATGANAYVLPTAKSDALGGIKVGSNLSIDPNTGVLSANAGAYTLPTASTTTLGGVKFQSQVNDFTQIEESQLFREGLVISRGMHIGNDAAALITEVKLNGTAIPSTDYVVDFNVLTLGGSTSLVYRCVVDWSIVFYFEDERTITAGSTIEFTVGSLILPGQGIVLGTSALTQNYTPFACGFYAGTNGCKVYVDKDTKLLQLTGSGLGIDQTVNS